MNNTHEGRVAVVTGAGRGIGREVAVRLAERGAQLVLIDLETPTETQTMVGGDPLVLTGTLVIPRLGRVLRELSDNDMAGRTLW